MPIFCMYIVHCILKCYVFFNTLVIDFFQTFTMVKRRREATVEEVESEENLEKRGFMELLKVIVGTLFVSSNESLLQIKLDSDISIVINSIFEFDINGLSLKILLLRNIVFDV